MRACLLFLAAKQNELSAGHGNHIRLIGKCGAAMLVRQPTEIFFASFLASGKKADERFACCWWFILTPQKDCLIGEKKGFEVPKKSWVQRRISLYLSFLGEKKDSFGDVCVVRSCILLEGGL